MIPPFQSGKGHFVVDDNIGLSLLLASAYKENKKPYIVLTSNLYKAQKIYEYLMSFLPTEEILLFPSDELIRSETIAQSKELVASRIYALARLLEKKDRIVVTNVASFIRYLPNLEVFSSKSFKFKIGSKINISHLRKSLVEAGYTLVNKVTQSLEFAIRGDIIDIFSVNLDNPIRIELFDEEIESIRIFDIATQISQKKIEKVEILPATEFLLSEEEIKGAGDKIRTILEKDKLDLDYNTFDALLEATDRDIESIITNVSSPRLYKYYSLLSSQPSSLLDYCSGYTLLMVDEASIFNSETMMKEESREFYRELFETGKLISHLEAYLDIKKLISFHNNPTVRTSILPRDSNDLLFEIKGVPYQASKKSDAINIIRNYLNSNYQIAICLATNEHLAFLSELLEAEHIPYEMGHDFDLPKKEKIVVQLTNLSRGFVYQDKNIVYLTSKELFNEKVNTARFDSRFKEGTILKSFEDLSPGDFVVHEYQGIGQFLELQTLEVDGIHRDYLKIAYWGDEILYVPLSQFQLVRKYLGKEGLKPRLSHLHTKDWENTKKRIKERIQDLANRLFNLYVERSKVVGYEFQKDDEIQQAFEASCPFELTKDQVRSINEIKADMESPHPMDRLLCGDVGFGKTEVAFQAIFKAINSGKQVALLCPTTLLARQHYERAVERFTPFDVNVALFSRFVAKSQQKDQILDIKNGKIHLVIGTHRLLSKDIVFKDLGLLVIDEEQRFGVEQKEKIKELKSNIDVLTLSATPIPRTLQISLLGVRSLSLINSAPKERMPVQTYVIPYNPDVAKELIQRELGRNGQVFYMHNNVETLYQTAAKLQRAMPEASIGIAHGQMDKRELEDVMSKFYANEISVLVCTTIIENGIDIPNVNMIIVEDSENYGLSQLYQIKGRVGRSDRIAYAYLMYNGNKILKDAAKKRLEAIQDFTQLGSGYKIAQRDLMIRGAGDILGPEQAGYIDSIGLDMYIKLLNDAVKEKIDGINPDDLLSHDVEANISLTIDAFIPSDYATDSDKIELYQEIMSASTSDSLLVLKRKTKDVYGTLPESVELLFIKKSVDLLLAEAGVQTLKEQPTFIEIYLGEPYINIRGIGNILFEALIPYISKIKVSYLNHRFKIVLKKGKGWLKDLEAILIGLENIKATNKIKEIK
ncbi:MAG: transcription-repair coupling factor [Bacilli bacterium]|nr:transcription-repair coupling factor [Bacilli bacterium]